MNDKQTSAIHWSFWLIGAVMLMWNVMGCINFFVQMNPGMLASYRESEQALITGRPVWATLAFAVAVFGGAAGCLLLLLKNTVSFYLFVVSLLGVVVTMVHSLGSGARFGIGEATGLVVLPLLVAGFLVWYAKYAKNKGWLRGNKR